MRLMVGLMCFLPVWAVVLVFPAVVTSQPAPHMVQRIWTQDAGGTDKIAFASGEIIQFAAQLIRRLAIL